MGFKLKGTLFLLHKVIKTEALLFANSKACNRRPVWKSASQTTNLYSGGIWTLIYVYFKTNWCDAATILFTCFESSSWRHCILWKFNWLQKYRCIYMALPMPLEKSTSHMCPITKLLFFKCHATFILPKWLRGNSEFFSYIPLNAKLLRSRKI